MLESISKLQHIMWEPLRRDMFCGWQTEKEKTKKPTKDESSESEEESEEESEDDKKKSTKKKEVSTCTFRYVTGTLRKFLIYIWKMYYIVRKINLEMTNEFSRRDI